MLYKNFMHIDLQFLTTKKGHNTSISYVASLLFIPTDILMYNLSAGNTFTLETCDNIFGKFCQIYRVLTPNMLHSFYKQLHYSLRLLQLSTQIDAH